MRIAIHAADLDHNRIDGTRVYLFNMLKNFGKIDSQDSFLIYHQNDFNPQLKPPVFANYSVKKSSFPLLWTQTAFAFKIWRDRPEVLWMPVHNLPILHRKNLKVVVTIHDLAFKIFPDYFTKKDLLKLNKLSDMAIKKADKIIAISQSTKNDILKFYPEISEEKITIIHHGFDAEIFQKKYSAEESDKLLKNYQLSTKNYLLYVGAIQPRKNLEVLIEAFAKIKRESASWRTDLKLVIAGAPAWKAEATLKKIAASPFGKDIIITGSLEFEKVAIFYQNAKIFVYPSLYEGFGIPILESMASGTPVICAKNSSLIEVGGEAALYFKTEDFNGLADCINKIIENEALEKELIQKSFEHIKKFSWEKCAQETLDYLLK
ncbi:MAG TPA: glycosyltransferase family 1 protein [Candidatus Moranbacteria bacterium]|nr:glycosyltransferase family 1 protein [Candidatus Moranbacteria bacterium]HRY27678.1 glycosyltransferase family 1 protein [Candidatus Moranbacteria bacterium]HSA07999.1 glycosyltransferase family 1 protein [Candidatus Moranbacteria bacterium]